MIEDRDHSESSRETGVRSMGPAPASSSEIDRQLLSRIPTLFVVLAALLGVVYAFTVPPFQVPDEFAHLFRAYGLSEGHFVAPALTPIPSSVSRLTGRFPPHLENTGRIGAGDLAAAVREPLNPADQIRVPNEGMNVNTWIPYAPSATMILVARTFHASPIAICYLGRLANLSGYIYLTWLALRIFPSGSLALFMVALMPMSLHQAASLSWDSIAFGIAFLFCGIVLRARQMPRPLHTQDYRILCLGVLILSLCKLDFALLPLLLLIPAPQYGSGKKKIWFLLLCILGAFLINALWQYLNRENLLLFKESVRTQFHTDFPNNIWYLYYNTGYFVNAVARSVVETGFLHLTEFVGTFGWLTVKLPPYLVCLYLAQMLLVGLTGLFGFRLSWIERGIVASVVLIGCFGAILAMWLETPEFYIQNALLHNIGTLYGLQGRHYIPFGFPALLLLSNRALRLRPLWLCASAVSVILVANGIGIARIKQTYYGTAVQAAEPVKANPPAK